MKLVDWRADHEWTRQFLPEIKSKLGRCLFVEAPYEEDAERNTDLVVVMSSAGRVAIRVRRYRYVEAYGNQFTIRAVRGSGTKTELDKIIEGWGEYIFYGFADRDERYLCAWFLGRLHEFRAWHSDSLRTHQGREPGFLQSNHDGSSDFRVYNLRDLPPSFFVHRSPFMAAAKVPA